MKMLLLRGESSEVSTIGSILIDGEFLCFSLEDPVRAIAPDGTGKIRGATAIPAGTYRVVVNHSQRFNRDMPRLLDVPHFTGILIHAGNTAEDTHGCILVGQRVSNGTIVRGSSTSAFLTVLGLINRAIEKGEIVEIEIVDAQRRT